MLVFKFPQIIGPMLWLWSLHTVVLRGWVLHTSLFSIYTPLYIKFSDFSWFSISCRHCADHTHSISSSGVFSALHTHISSCLNDIYTWMYNRHLNLIHLKLKFWYISHLKPYPPVIVPVWLNYNSTFLISQPQNLESPLISLFSLKAQSKLLCLLKSIQILITFHHLSSLRFLFLFKEAFPKINQSIYLPLSVFIYYLSLIFMLSKLVSCICSL